MSHIYNFNHDSERARWLKTCVKEHGKAMLERWRKERVLTHGKANAQAWMLGLIEQSKT